MERGVEMEEEARRWYAMERDVDVTRAGLVLRDDGLVVGSPDGLVGEDGVVEIKCPSAAQHMRYRLGEEPDYLGQVQGYLYLTGRQWCDFLSYHPELKPFLRRYPRDEEYLAALVPVLDEFAEQCARDREDFAVERVLRPWDMEMRAEMNEANREEV
jgi:exodeoxyribonuclease (lambda-induced)